MRNNYRDHDDHCTLYNFNNFNILPARSRSREKEDRDYSHRYPPRDNRNIVKLHVGNLPLNTPEEVVQSQFQRFGRVEDVKIMRKNANGQPLREFLYGFIVMNNEEEAKRALELINRNTELGWQVSYSKEKPRGGGDDHRRSPDRYHHHQHQNQNQHHGQGQHYQPHHYHNRDPRDQRDMREHRDYRDHRDQRDPRDQRDYRYRRDDDDYHNRYRRDRSPRRNDYGDNRRRDRSGSLENRNEGQAAPNQGSALMNILQKNMGANNQDTTADLLTILNLPPEKLAELTTSMEKNILNGVLLIIKKEIIKSFLLLNQSFPLNSCNPFFSDARSSPELITIFVLNPCISRKVLLRLTHFLPIRLLSALISFFLFLPNPAYFFSHPPSIHL